MWITLRPDAWALQFPKYGLCFLGSPRPPAFPGPGGAPEVTAPTQLRPLGSGLEGSKVGV